MTVEAYIPKHKYIATTLQSSNIDIDLANAKVLELWGNAGTLLKDPENQVAEENAREGFGRGACSGTWSEYRCGQRQDAQVQDEDR